MSNEEVNPSERTHSVTNTVNQCAEGDKAAESELVQLLKEKLRLLAELESYVERELPPILRRRIDTEALVYERRALLLGVRQRKFPELTSRQNVRQLLYARVKQLVQQAIRDNVDREIRNVYNEVHIEGILDRLAAKQSELADGPAEPPRPSAGGLSPDDANRLVKAKELAGGVDPMAMSILEELLRDRTVAQIARTKHVGVGNVRKNIIRLMIDALTTGTSSERSRGES